VTYRIDEQGTVLLDGHRIPVPTSISPEARDYLSQNLWGADAVASAELPMWETRDATAVAFEALNAMARQMFPVTVREIDINGVRCHRVEPLDTPPENRDRVLINLHGGGFVLGSGSLAEAIPIAHLSRIPVIAVDYRLAPEHPYPAAVDDALQVYRHCLDTLQAQQIGIYGSSAGGFITGQAIARCIREELPLPACVGIFSAGGDLIDFGDTSHIFTLNGFFGHLILPLDHPKSEVRAYLGGADPHDPLVSPLLSDLSRFPPALIISGTRDALLSAATNFHRALRRAGAEADLMVFDAMPHTHWYALHLPETREALDAMVSFFTSRLG
jgi:monoterpene epsilon-lactone hydrolase